MQWSGVAWSGVTWVAAQWRNARTHTHTYTGVLAFAGTGTGDGFHVLSAAKCPSCRQRRRGSPFDPLPVAPPPGAPAPPAAHPVADAPDAPEEPFEPEDPSDPHFAADQVVMQEAYNNLSGIPQFPVSLRAIRNARDDFRAGVKANDVLTASILMDIIMG